MEKVVFVSLTDELYFPKLRQTIKDLREPTRGNWKGNVVVICIHFSLPEDFKNEYNVCDVSFDEIEKTEMLSRIKVKFENGDGREFDKLNQWEKMHVFDEYFFAWDKVIFVDAGLRIFDSVQHLLDLDCNGVFLAPNDAGYSNKPDKIFRAQISHRNHDLIDKLTQEFGIGILESQYFLNCIWVFDTKILNTVKKDELIEYMNKYPMCITNEMAIMNMVIHFKHKLWRELPHFSSGPNPKFLFDWCEYNNPGTNWTNYCYLKYPVTIQFDT